MARNVFNLPAVVATASRKETIESCKRMGATHVIDHRKDLVEQVEALELDVPIKYTYHFLLPCPSPTYLTDHPHQIHLHPRPNRTIPLSRRHDLRALRQSLLDRAGRHPLLRNRVHVQIVDFLLGLAWDWFLPPHQSWGLSDHDYNFGESDGRGKAGANVGQAIQVDACWVEGGASPDRVEDYSG
jgi:hypothetical protein